MDTVRTGASDQSVHYRDVESILRCLAFATASRRPGTRRELGQHHTVQRRRTLSAIGLKIRCLAKDRPLGVHFGTPDKAPFAGRSASRWAQQDSNLRPADYESAALTN